MCVWLCYFWLGTQYTEYLQVQPYKIWMHLSWPSILCRHSLEVHPFLSYLQSWSIGPCFQASHVPCWVNFVIYFTAGIGKSQLQHPASSSRKACGVDPSSKISLPVFGLASYKLRGSILTTNGPQDLQQASSLLQAADNWLHRFQVHLPDFQFFVSHNSQLRWQRYLNLL